jgi:hypothetical protein
MFELLRDPVLFEQATVDSELGTVVWPNGADLSPEFLYAGGMRGTVSAEAALASTDIPVQDQSIERDE